MSFSRVDHRGRHNHFRSISAAASGGGVGNRSSYGDLSGKPRGRFFSSSGINDDAVAAPPHLKRKRSSPSRDDEGVRMSSNFPSTSNSLSLPPPKQQPGRHESGKLKVEEDAMVFMSRDEIERCSPSRRDGIDSVRESYLRYSYCCFIQNLAMRLGVPQTTIATGIVFCHRFYVRRSHAYHDRYLIATAALFLAAKSEDTPCPLDTVLRTSCEIFYKQDFAFFRHPLYGDWFEQYRERVIQAEHLLLTTLDFELAVQHPYAALTSAFGKVGLSQTVLLNLAWNLINEGLYSSLWLQFKPHHIAAGAAYLAAKFLNFDLTSYQSIWQELQVTPFVLQDVVIQLLEIFQDRTR